MMFVLIKPEKQKNEKKITRLLIVGFVAALDPRFSAKFRSMASRQWFFAADLGYV
jgi:hypothetical protein